MSLRTTILFMTFLLSYAGTGYSKNMDLGNLVSCARFAKSDDFYLPDANILVVRGSKKLIVFNESFVHEVPIPANPLALELSFTPYVAKGKTVTGVLLYLEQGRMISPPKAVLSDGRTVDPSSLQQYRRISLRGSRLTVLPSLNTALGGEIILPCSRYRRTPVTVFPFAT